MARIRRKALVDLSLASNASIAWHTCAEIRALRADTSGPVDTRVARTMVNSELAVHTVIAAGALAEIHAEMIDASAAVHAGTRGALVNVGLT